VDYTVCDSSSEGELAVVSVVSALTTDSTICGPYAIIPCLGDNECTLDASQTGCSYDADSDALSIYATVNFNDNVWTVTERNSLVEVENGTMRFWDCSNKRRKRARDLERYAQLEELTRMQSGPSSLISETVEDGKPAGADDVRLGSLVLIGLISLIAILITVVLVIRRRQLKKSIPRDSVDSECR